VGGIGIGVDVEMGVIGGDSGMVLWMISWGGVLMLLLLLLLKEGESEPIRVLNRGFRIRGEGKGVFL